ncbi:MAG: tRNA guanosine(34) transglycosylase Tgt, partial [bacterium]|nr:tRNA guanosine(34) transglycosylase Tgt [bacterium]
MKRFKVLHKVKNARVGELQTDYGIIQTPAFIPVGTQATVKAVNPRDLKEI